MNILFILRGTGIGGIEVVTKVLAEKFIKEGHWVGFFIFRKDKGASITDGLDPSVAVYQQNNYKVTEENIDSLRKILFDNHVDIIINQWGLPLVPIKTAEKAIKGLPVKIISVYHQAPNANGRIQSVDDEIVKCRSWKKLQFLKLKRFVFSEVTSYAIRYNYNHSNKFLVLSESYKKIFKKFTHISNLSKLGVMTNPVTIETGGYHYSANSKQKEIIYVGRLDSIQKRVYRIIDSWSLIEDKYPDWKLTIVGDGPERNNLENQVKVLGLCKVSFAGFRKPLEFYKRARVLVLASDFEGFPLVLAEAMSFGVIPIVYDSFASVRDIISDGKNGIIVPKDNGNFNTEIFSSAIEQVIVNTDKMLSMALSAIESSKNYSVDAIYNRWMKVFKELS